ncbi:SDR family NAD(P)-dependent oxidoreductase [Amnibacterium setariae]|uniref:SDR family oxidoreductase n=1 Tax=Amnibacterium setariae TaxID=2306585 RepID=A0A3A1U312_9MICO|nr:SDR family oxidoreductase [Amnibacterium setariae]RIX31244.1 SDR family oxidoreductase [Amnibacterium setariae]
MTVNRYAVEGRAVLVTGGGSGIGAAIARAFLDNGARVAVTGRREDALQRVVDGAEEGRALAVQGDVGDPADVARVVAAVVEAFGGLDVVVSNAAGYAAGELVDLSASDWEALRRTNVDGLFHLAQAVLPHLEASKGSLVAVASVSGLSGDWGQAAYNATKHAVVGFVQSLALDYGGRGVRVNAVAPAFTQTEMTAGVGSDDESLAPFVDRIALGRPGLPEDVAPAVLFLATEDAGYIMGAVLTVDGGTSASTGQPR